MKKKITLFITLIILATLVYILYKYITAMPEDTSILSPAPSNQVPKDNEYVPVVSNVESLHFYSKLDYQWTFASKLPFSSAIDTANGVVLFYAHDGLLGGHHDSEYLYGVNKEDGSLIWSVYGGFLPIKYSIDEEKDKIFITSVKVDPKYQSLSLEVISLTLTSGEVNWAVNIPDANYCINLSCSSKMLTVEYMTKDKNILLSMNPDNGEKYDETFLIYDETLYNNTRIMPALIIQGSEYIKALDPVTKDELWKLDEASVLYEEWALSNNEVIKFNIKDGKILNKLPVGNVIGFHLNDDRNIIIRSQQSGKSDVSSIFSLDKNELMYESEMIISHFTINNDKMIFVSENNIFFHSLTDKVTSSGYRIAFDNEKEQVMDLLYLEDTAYVVTEYNIYMIDPHTGETYGSLDEYNRDNYAANIKLLPDYISKIKRYENYIFIPRPDGYVDCFLKVQSD